MNILYNDYFKKLSACYLGKAIGGTLGMPFEGNTNTNSIEYYTPVPEKMCGNDDIDLQVVWVETLLREGFPVNRYHLSISWEHLNFGPDEYGIALHNQRSGIFAPLSGILGNKFHNGMGATIRSEIWAALAPGDPELAVSLAREDACVDHYSSGLSGSLFLTAIESAAYTENDTEKLINIGLSFIEDDIILSAAIKDTIAWYDEYKEIFKVREKIISKYSTDNWSDVIVNISFLILAWIAGKGDFGKSICYATNCGYDADCTAASLGALLGILNPDGIDEKWITPIGKSLVLSPQILGLRTSSSIDEFCKKICALAKCSNDYYNSEVKITDIPDEIRISAEKIPIWTKNPSLISYTDTPERESLICVSPLVIKLIYPKNIALVHNRKSIFGAIISNPTDKMMQIDLTLRIPECFTISENTFSFSLKGNESHKISFEIENNTNYKSASDFLDLVFSINGISFTAKAGLITAYPWLAKDIKDDTYIPNCNSLQGAVYSPANSIVIPVGKGKKLLAIEVRIPMKQEVAITCQGTRPLKLWIDENNILNYDAKCYVPALHRGQAVLHDLTSEWHKVLIQVEDGDEGEVFFAIGNPIDWIWLNVTEWREPKI